MRHESAARFVVFSGGRAPRQAELAGGSRDGDIMACTVRD